MVIEYGVALEPAPGQVETGDGYLVKEVPNGVLVAVVDGLGHGPEAAVARQTAVDTMEAHPQEDVATLLNYCHQQLLTTRGAVISIAFLDHQRATMHWLGVGNVTGILVQEQPEKCSEQIVLVTRNGIVGQNVPSLKPTTVPISPGDTLVFVTDGIKAEFFQRIEHTAPPNQVAEQILRDYILKNDDALVLVVRYLGTSDES